MKKFNKFSAMFLSLIILMIGSNLFAQSNVPNPPKEIAVSTYLSSKSPAEFGVNLSFMSGDDGKATPAAGYNVILRRQTNGQIVEKLYETIKVMNGEKSFKANYTGFQPNEKVQILVSAITYDDKQNIIESKKIESKWVTAPTSGSDDDEFIRVKVEAAAEMKVGEKRTYPIVIETNIKGGVVKYTVKQYNDMELLNNELDPAKPAITVWSDKEGYKALIIVTTITNSAGKAFTSDTYIKTKVGTGNNNDAPFLRFVNIPQVVKVTKNTPYTMVFKTESNTNCPVDFKILKTNVPTDKYKFNETSGVLVFTPTDADTMGAPFFGVQARAICPNDTLNKQLVAYTSVSFELFDKDVNTKETCSFYGSVYDKANPNELISGVAILYPLTKVLNGMEKAYKVEFKNSTFAFTKIPANIEYKLQVLAKGYQQQWYQNATEMSQAEVLVLKPSVDFKLNPMNLTKLVPRKMFAVSGTVLDETGKAIVKAQVRFTPSDIVFNTGNKQDLGDFIADVATDENGKYTINLPENGVFIAQASTPMSSNTAKPQVRFYNNVTTPLEADIILVDGDITGIDFTFDKPTLQPTNSFSGKVVDENGTPIIASLTAMQVGTNAGANTKGRIYSTRSDANGNYTFDKIEYGTYVVLSLPEAKTYIPGYINNGNLVSQKWKEATQITVNDMMSQVQYIAKHKALPVKQGVGDVSGFVNGKKGIANKKDNALGAVDVLSGALVYLVDLNGVVVNYSFTEKTGQFSMDQIEDGIYNVTSDAIGFAPSTMQVNINYKTSPSAKTEITMDNEAIASIEPELNSENFVVYPVPANAEVTLNFNAIGGNATINVMTMTGGLVMSQDVQVIDGLNLSKLNFSNLSTGSYIITINNAGKMLARTINVIR